MANLRNVAQCRSSVVAVVGRGHLSGMSKHWEEDINVRKTFTMTYGTKLLLCLGGLL